MKVFISVICIIVLIISVKAQSFHTPTPAVNGNFFQTGNDFEHSARNFNPVGGQPLPSADRYGRALSGTSTSFSTGNGMRFTPNKGQVIDMDGNLCPDILYKGEGGGADIYLRKTGISYVYSNMSEVMHRVNEETEKAVTLNILSKEKEQQFKDELLQKEKIKMHRVDMDFEGALYIVTNTLKGVEVSMEAEDELDGYENYYYPHCPQGITHVKQYNKITYKNIYNNIDVSYYGDKQNGLKYDLVVQPYADPNQIKIQWKGAESMSINREGNLVIKTSVNEFTESIPKVYQNINGKIVDIKAEYILNATTVSFKLGTWNPEYSLIIDPWATYYGGAADDFGSDIATDNAGNMVVSGFTQSANLPILSVAGGYSQAYIALQDIFVVKFSPTGTRLWATLYGGSSSEQAHAIATDNAGNVVITGNTQSNNFPVLTMTGGYSQALSSLINIFVVKFDPAGVRQWATYYGGNKYDYGEDIATDNAGNVIVTGHANSTNFPVIAPALAYAQAFGGGLYDAFVLKFNPNGARLWATCYGGTGYDYGEGIATDISGNVVISGYTTSANFPVLSAGGYTQAFGGGFTNDAFVVKFNTAGTRQWATFYGGSADDYGHGITTDLSGNIIMVGSTRSTDFPLQTLPGGYVQTFGGGPNIGFGSGAFGGDAFLVKFNNAGMRLWATFYGGSADEYGDGVVTDANNNVYLLMEAEDQPAPTLIDACSYQPIFNGGIPNDPYKGPSGGPDSEDQIIVKFTQDGKKLCGSYLGGKGEDDIDWGGGPAIYGNSLYITGFTDGGYPVTAGAFQTVFGGPLNTAGPYLGRSDAFIASICANICGGINATGLNFNSNATIVCPNVPIAFTSTGNTVCDTTNYKIRWTFTGGNPSTSFSSNPSVTYATPGFYSVKLVVTTACQKDSVIKANYIIVNPCTITASVTGATICPNTCTGITAIGSGGTAPYTFSWSTGETTATINVCPATTTNYTVMVKDASGNFAATTTTVTVQTPAEVTTLSTDITCSRSGSATVTLISGTAPFTFKWSNGSVTYATSFSKATSEIYGIAAGGYTVTITDGNGCTLTRTFNIANASPVSAAFTTSSFCLGGPVNFTNTGTPPGTGITYSWVISLNTTTITTGSTTNFSYTFLTAGTYSISHSVSNGTCNNTIINNITIINCANPSVNATGAATCAGSCTNVTSAVIGGTTPYSYTWSNGATTQNINVCPAATTTYTVTIKDSGGKTATSSATAVITSAVNISVTSTNINCSGLTNGNAIATGSNGTAPYTYSWNNGSTTSQISNLASQTYTITVTDSKGCKSTSTAAITSPPPLFGQFNKGTAACTGCGCKQWILINAKGGTDPYTYLWPDGYTNRYKNQLCPGNYSVNIKDKNGCSVNVNLTTP